MKILVTGASGFIGRRVCRRLISRGHQVVGLSSAKPTDLRGFAGYIQEDISKPLRVDGDFDALIHLAAYNVTHVGDTASDLYERVNVDGTRHILEAVNARQTVFLSTVKLYRYEGLPLSEASSLDPKGTYAQSKWKAEDICLRLAQHRPMVILRSSNVIGFGQAPKAVLPLFFEKAKQGQDLDLIVSSRTPVQFVYVDDLIDAIEAVLVRSGISGVFNIASTETITMGELARKVIEVTGSSAVVNCRAGQEDVLISRVVTDKAAKELGWTAQTDLDTILKRYVEEDGSHA